MSDVDMDYIEAIAMEADYWTDQMLKEKQSVFTKENEEDE